MKTKTIKGHCGGSKTPCRVFVAEVQGGAYYCVDGSTNVNATTEMEKLVDGCDVEVLNDCNSLQADEPVESEEDIEREVEDYYS